MSANTTCTPDIHALARQLAQPVVRGWLSRGAANSTLIAAALDEERDRGWERVFERARFLQWQMNQEIRWLEIARDMAEARIRRIVRNMLRMQRPPNAVAAEAHNINGDAGFPLAESYVNAVLLDVVEGVRRYG
jgi:hypothetical protein